MVISGNSLFFTCLFPELSCILLQAWGIFTCINNEVMKTHQFNREVVVTIISILLSVLFIYTAIMKIREYGIFKVRLDQSPMLEGMGEWLAVLIPVALLSVALLLLMERTRLF